MRLKTVAIQQIYQCDETARTAWLRIRCDTCGPRPLREFAADGSIPSPATTFRSGCAFAPPTPAAASLASFPLLSFLPPPGYRNKARPCLSRFGVGRPIVQELAGPTCDCRGIVSGR